MGSGRGLEGGGPGHLGEDDDHDHGVVADGVLVAIPIVIGYYPLPPWRPSP